MDPIRFPGRVITAVALALSLIGCGPLGPSVAPSTLPGASSGAPSLRWPAPPNPMDLARDAGLAPETIEHLEFHVHAHLDVFLDGARVEVPAGIGINIDDPGVQSGPEFDGSLSYGGIIEPCTTPCISPLHTHAHFGILHTESATTTPNTLGEFFVEWAAKLSETCVGDICDKPITFYVNGVKFAGDPTTIELADRAVIVIVIGTPPAVIPATADFNSP
jgi:hypothetical protein